MQNKLDVQHGPNYRMVGLSSQFESIYMYVIR